MANATETSKWLTLSITLTFATVSASAAAISVYYWNKKSGDWNQKLIKELEKSLKESLKKCAAERQGRIRAQQVGIYSVISSKAKDGEQLVPANVKRGVGSGFLKILPTWLLYKSNSKMFRCGDFRPGQPTLDIHM